MTRNNYILDAITHGDVSEWKGRMREQYDDVSKRWYATVAPFNLLAGIYMMDAIDLIEDRGLGKHKTKGLIARATKGLASFQIALRIAFSHHKDGLAENRYNLVSNMANQLVDKTKTDVFYLRMAIKSCLDKNNESDTEFRSHIILANTLLDFAVQLFDEFFKAYRQRTMADFSHDFMQGRLGGVFQTFDSICRIVCKTDKNIDLNADKGCIIAFKALNQRIADGDILNAAGLDAMRFDEVYAKMVDEEEESDIKSELSKKYKVR